ncbi:hypothetical protein [Velocimicrobium porci]|uniref:hypothetical protein n=1 Tax=Velocimicrobium porci TaxID=2606634 RepID=UPI0012B1E52F|nr:hypothetical protein [Velocimicrobium porci]
MKNLKKEKDELVEMAKLLAQLSPEERETLKKGILIGKVIFKDTNTPRQTA